MTFRLNHSFVLGALLLVVVGCLAVYNWNIILSAHPIEYREGHSMSSTTLMLNHTRPFTLETYPEYYNSYGIVFNIAVLPFTAIFGNKLPVYRLLNEIFLLIALAFLLFYKQKKPSLASLLVTCNLYLFFHVNSNISIRPDGLGTMFFILSILIPVRRSFDDRSLILVAILAILAFYTKAYYILGWYALSAMMLFKSPKKFLVANIVFHLIFILSALLVNKLLPLYFYETVFVYGNAPGDLSYSISQLLRSLKILTPTLLLCIVPFIMVAIRKEPLQEITWIYYLPSFLVLVVLVFLLGTNDGAYLSYHAQLLGPALAIPAIEWNNKHHIYPVLQWLICLTLAFSVYKMPFPHPSRTPAGWEKIETYISNSNKILNVEPVSAILQINGKELVDDGVSGWVYEFTEKPITNFLFGKDSELAQKKNSYIETIRKNIAHQVYDLVILREDSRWYQNCLDAGYMVKESIDVDLPCNWSLSLDILMR